MRVLIVAALIAAALPAVQVHAQATPDAATQPGSIAERFLQTLKAGQAGEALAIIGSNSPMMAKKIASDPSLLAQIQLALTAYGPVVGWEKVDSESLGTMMRRDTFVVQQRDAVTRWRFVYARVGAGWIVAHFSFEDQVQTWFK